MRMRVSAHCTHMTDCTCALIAISFNIVLTATSAFSCVKEIITTFSNNKKHSCNGGHTQTCTCITLIEQHTSLYNDILYYTCMCFM